MSAYTMKDSGVEWLGDIPEHWKVDRVKDVTTQVVGGDWGADIDSSVDGENIIVLRVADIEGIYFSYKNLTYRKIKLSSIKSRKLDENCLIIEKSGGGEKQLVGRTALPKSLNEIAINSNFMTKIEISEIAHTPFINYVMNTLYGRRLNYPHVQQTTGIQNLNVNYYLTTKVALPSKEEQKAIATYLGKACEKIDKTISLKQQQLDKLDDYRKSIIHEAVTKGLDKNVPMKDSGVEWLGDIPDHWNLDRLKDVSTLRDKKCSIKSDVNDYLELEDLSQWTGKIINKRNTLNVASDVMLFHANDVLFGKLRPYLAKVALAKFHGKCTGEILAIQPVRVLGTFLAYYLISKNFINHCNNFSYGAKMPRINWNTQMGMFPIVFPEKAEQKTIANYLDKACEKIDRTKTVIEAQIEKLTEYRQSLIHECVTGKKRVYQGDIN